MFASADGANMQKLVTGGQVTAEPTVFAANQLIIVVKPGNPKNVKTLADLPEPRRRLAVRRRRCRAASTRTQILQPARV